MRAGRDVMALDTPTLLACAKIAVSTLNYWVEKGFCTPDIDAGQGRRATRYWSVRDLVVVKTIKALRDAGCSLQNVSKVEKRLTEIWGTDLSNSVLYYNGKDVLILDDAAIMSVLDEAGQGVFAEALTVLTAPLGKWVEEGNALAKPVDIAEIRARRVALQGSRATA